MRGRGRRSAAAGLAGLVVLTAAAAGCGRNAAPGGERGAALPPDTVVGTVRQVGSTPFTRTVVEGDAAVTVTGPAEAELSRITGARVRVVGTSVEGETPGRTLRVERYEILSVDGEEPRVGVLRHETGAGYRLEGEGGDLVPLRAVPTRLGGQVGARVWVVLDDSGGVLRYGVLREP